tara:strand:+ start:167 stop:529 length:363 start_codon:yes stop_codon:yes gene_type:complete
LEKHISKLEAVRLKVKVLTNCQHCDDFSIVYTCTLATMSSHEEIHGPLKPLKNCVKCVATITTLCAASAVSFNIFRCITCKAFICESCEQQQQKNSLCGGKRKLKSGNDSKSEKRSKSSE